MLSKFPAVYRLENSEGGGPFTSTGPCGNFLRHHDEPYSLLSIMNLPREIKNVLRKAKFIFGWESIELFKDFFIQGGELACERQGYGMNVYYPEHKLVFPDGQVWFSRSDATVSPTLSKLLVDLANDSPDCATLENETWLEVLEDYEHD